MSIENTEISDEILVQLRKIVRAMDLHSRQLHRSCTLTSPQLVLLREIVRQDVISIGSLAKHASLSNATVTGIVDRLEQRGLVVRNRNGKDRRQVLLSSTETGCTLCTEAPPLLQEKFLASLADLKQWEQAQMLASLSRLATMMNGSPKEAFQAEAGTEAAEGISRPDSFIAPYKMLLEKELPQSPPEDTECIALVLHEIHTDEDLPEGMTRKFLSCFLNEHLRPYEDTVEDILQGLDYAFSSSEEKGGFVLLAKMRKKVVGVLVILNTGMSGYVPEHLLLFVAVDGAVRGRGIGAHLIRHAQDLCSGNIKLHVEYDNPAKRLYERMGFSSKYAEMRWEK